MPATWGKRRAGPGAEETHSTKVQEQDQTLKLNPDLIKYKGCRLWFMALSPIGLSNKHQTVWLYTA